MESKFSKIHIFKPGVRRAGSACDYIDVNDKPLSKRFLAYIYSQPQNDDQLKRLFVRDHLRTESLYLCSQVTTKTLVLCPYAPCICINTHSFCRYLLAFSHTCKVKSSRQRSIINKSITDHKTELKQIDIAFLRFV